MPPPFRHLLNEDAIPLAVKLGRSEEELRARGLNVRDFNGTLNFFFEDGSHATFRYAFFLHDPVKRAIVVFTEHCGYFVFPDWLRVLDAEGRTLFDRLP
ncbi:hypothetical protein DAERI_060229 [Deinococcus aerius]|uniref:Uncharacterized protein n=1 Tax=Deinococcus aerius TaxID=200253 RepID=A0A2I9CVJ4_9DEIO|nr:hypothetical protein [Deinococcus aerius]GBF05969.1 hypothetical protein DAERI_060229 [Deinococcus aerius]